MTPDGKVGIPSTDALLPTIPDNALDETDAGGKTRRKWISILLSALIRRALRALGTVLCARRQGAEKKKPSRPATGQRKQLSYPV